MTTHIDYAVTEVIAESGGEEATAEGDDGRWNEQHKVEAHMKRHQRMYERVQAEGFDD